MSRSQHKALLRRRLSLLVAATPLLCGTPVQADELEPNIGAFVGVSFGNGPASLEWGAELAVVTREDSCCDESASSQLGVVARLAFFNLRPTVTLSALGRSKEYDSVKLGGEVGLRFGFQGAPFVSAHTGAYLQKDGANLYFRRSWSHGENSAGLSLIEEPVAEPLAVDGRPFRNASGQSQRAHSIGSQAHRCDLARHWEERAHDECASIPAFLQLASELLDLGAPLHLVERALDAAEDEIRHTKAVTAIAHSFGSTITPQPPAYLPRPKLDRSAQLSRLALEAWLDGCLGEGMAANIALAEAAESTNPSICSVQAQIAKDEAEHAELSWDILQWALKLEPSIARLIAKEKQVELGFSTEVLTRSLRRDISLGLHRESRNRLNALV